MKSPQKEVIHRLKNGRVYRVIDTGLPYKNGEYPSDGFHICVLLPGKMITDENGWGYIDNSPDQECVNNFLKAAERLKPLEEK